MKNKLRVGFIGLGLMGNPMAQNIHKAGFPLVVYNRNPKRTAEFKKMDVTIAQSASDLASQVDVVITMVTGPKDVEDVIFGRNGVAEGMKKGGVIIDMSTIGPESVKVIAQKLAALKIDFLDAPVTGGTNGAKAGTLTIFAGGKEAVFKKMLPLFDAMGKNNLYIGPTGSGQAIKLVNNLIVGETLTALAEGFLLGEAQGLSRKKVAQFLENVPALSPMMKTRFEKMITNKYDVTFSVANMHKDLDLARKEVKKAGKDLPVLETVTKLYKKGIDQGLAEKDNAAVLEVLDS